MLFLQLDELLDLVKAEQAELHRQAARDALAAQATARPSSTTRPQLWSRLTSFIRTARHRPTRRTTQSA